MENNLSSQKKKKLDFGKDEAKNLLAVQGPDGFYNNSNEAKSYTMEELNQQRIFLREYFFYKLTSNTSLFFQIHP